MLLKRVFVLILAFGYIDLDFIRRRLRISKEDLQPKLCRMHSLLNVTDSEIKPYHLSLLDFLRDKKRAGKYYVHPLSLTLLRMPVSMKRAFDGRGGIGPGYLLLLFALSCVLVSGFGGWRRMLIRIGVLVVIVLPGLIWVMHYMQHKQKEEVIRGLLETHRIRKTGNSPVDCFPIKLK